MNKIHPKSSCCKALVRSKGGKRRVCTSCGHSWTIKPKRRGRKRVRVHPNSKTFATSSRDTLRERARRSGKSREQVRRRHGRNIDMLLKTLPIQAPPPSKQLIAVIDATPYRIGGIEYTLYIVTLRPVDSSTATVCDPILLKGCEGGRQWQYVLETLSSDIQERVVALVSDGKIGLETYAKRKGWVFQRCHFHLIKELQSLRGAKWSTSTKVQLRESAYQKIRQALETNTDQKAYRLYDEITKLVYDPQCPKWFGRRSRGFLRSFEHFRAYRRYPELNLPITTNTVESLFNRIGELCRQTKGFRTPESLLKWVKLYIRLNPKIRCNGH